MRSFAVLMVVLASCAAPRTQAGLAVKVTDDARDVAGCDLINRFQGRTSAGADFPEAVARLQEVAASRGANVVFLVGGTDSHGSVAIGDGYSCPGKSATAPAPETGAPPDPAGH